MVTLLHPERYSTTGVTARKDGVIVHDAESGDGAFATLLRLLESPGDRPIEGATPPRKYGSGYHAITDGQGGYLEVAPATAGPYGAPPLNKTWWHVCMPGRANQTETEWLDPISRAHVLGAARFIADKAAVDGFPIRRVFAAELIAGMGGVTSHAEVSKAWHQTDHTDPGPNFPWLTLMTDVARLSSPPPPPLPPNPYQEDDMPRLIRVTDDAAVLIVDGTTASWGVSGDVIGDLIAAGILPPRVAGQLPIALVPRRALKGLHYRGPLPDYTGTDPGLAGRTRSVDFASHTP